MKRSIFGGPSQKEQVVEASMRPSTREDEHPFVAPTKQYVLVPQLNRLYDNIKTQQTWRYGADLVFDLSAIALAGGANTVTTTLTLPQGTAPFKLSEWPQGTRCYLTLVFLSLGVQAAPTTGGLVHVYFQPVGGQPIPLGLFSTGGFALTENKSLFIPYPYTDPSITSIGSLVLKQTSSGATAATVDAQIVFSESYLLQARYGNALMTVEQFNEYTRKV
jgi:hypothetical protein